MRTPFASSADWTVSGFPATDVFETVATESLVLAISRSSEPTPSVVDVTTISTVVVFPTVTVSVDGWTTTLVVPAPIAIPAQRDTAIQRPNTVAIFLIKYTVSISRIKYSGY
ncbi:hypothetical protein [Haloarcula sp. CGMCC 1.6347]|uniref:hypothetical protein n=1 Tax=Haloarcula sp. CGMCC 1.6347 TaxID=3111455 RepID=UPI003FA57F49